jgi:hypothetical protein
MVLRRKIGPRKEEVTGEARENSSFIICNIPWKLIRFETSTLPHFVDNRLTDGGANISPQLVTPPLPPHPKEDR